MTLEAATEVFVRAFAEGKSFYGPYMLDRTDGLWVMHDPPGTRSPRKTEVVAVGLTPKEAVRRAQAAGLGWHFLCHIQDPDGDHNMVRRLFKSLGYRALSTEGMFVHDLAAIPEYESDPPVRRVLTSDEWAAIPQVASQKRKLRGGWRLFGIWDEARDYGWVESAPVGEDAWVSGLHVHNGFRGRGFGRALMSRLLRDDRANGVRASVLLASSSGARLYPHLGYRKIGTLQMFCPVERGPG